MAPQAPKNRRPDATTLRDIAEMMVSPDRWGEMDSQLRNALYWTGGLLGAGMVSVFFLRAFFWNVALTGFFDRLADYSLIPFFLLCSPVGIGILVVALGLWVATAWHTDGFQRGVLDWHQVGTGVVAVGALTAVALSLPLLNLLASILIFVLALALIIAVLTAA